MSRGHSRRVVARRQRRADDRHRRHGADPTTTGSRPAPVPAEQLDQLDQLATAARQQQPTTAQPARRGGRRNGGPGGDSAAASRPVVPKRPPVDDSVPCACQDGGPKCLLHYSVRRR